MLVYCFVFFYAAGKPRHFRYRLQAGTNGYYRPAVSVIAAMRSVFVFLVFVLNSLPVAAQPWSVFGGAAVSYDAFLRDAAVKKANTGWPFRVGGGIVAGAGYHAANGFDAFAEVNAGAVNLSLPLQEKSAAQAYLTNYVIRCMVGSGPRISLREGASTLTPFLQLGGAYMVNNGFGTGGSGSELLLHPNSETGFENWLIAVGAGIDWRFTAKLPSSLNLNFSYTPLNIFREPFDYTVATGSSTYEVAAQGKMLQVLLSYRVHLRLGKTREDF